MRIIDRARVSLRNWMLQDPATKVVYEGWAGGKSASGESVTVDRALTYSAVYGCVRVLSSAVAGLPLITYRRTAGGRERADKTDLYWILHDQPNDEQTPFVFKETIMVHLLLYGNAYCEIRRTEGGRLVGLDIIDPMTITPVRTNGQLLYEYGSGAGKKILKPEQILHFVGMGYDGLKGYSVISKAREAIGLGLATEKFGATFFGNGAWPGLVAVHPNTMTKEVTDRLRANWNELHSGPDKAHRLAVLEGGMKLERVTINADDAQFLESRQFQVEEIARWFGVPPHKIAHKYAERPGGSLEAQNTEFVTDSLRPWLVRIEQEIARKLIPYRDRSVVYTEFLVDALLRGDISTRYEAYSTAKTNGWLSVNEIRAYENLNSIGPEGDVYAATKSPEPVAAAAPTTANEDPTESQAPSRSVDMSAFRGLFTDSMARMIRSESGAVEKIASRGAEGFVDSVREFYGKHQSKVADVLVPAVRASLAAAGRDGNPEALARAEAEAHCEGAVLALSELVGSADLTAAVREHFATWAAARPEEVADEFVVQGSQSTSRGSEGQRVTLNFPAPVVNVPAPVVNVPAPVVSVQAPVVNVPAPVVNVMPPPERSRPVVRETRQVVRDPDTNLITQVITLKEDD